MGILVTVRDGYCLPGCGLKAGWGWECMSSTPDSLIIIMIKHRKSNSKTKTPVHTHGHKTMNTRRLITRVGSSVRETMRKHN